MTVNEILSCVVAGMVNKSLIEIFSKEISNNYEDFIERVRLHCRINYSLFDSSDISQVSYQDIREDNDNLEAEINEQEMGRNTNQPISNQNQTWGGRLLNILGRK